MPTTTLLPNSVSLGQWEQFPAAGSGVEDIDEGVDTHNGDTDYIYATRGGLAGNKTATIDFQDVSGSGTYSSILLRFAIAANHDGADPPLGGGDANVLVKLIVDGATVAKVCLIIIGDTEDYTVGALQYIPGTPLTVAQVNGAQARFIRTFEEDSEDPACVGAQTIPQIRLTATELVASSSSSGGPVSGSDSITFSESATVSGSGSTTSASGSDALTFSEGAVVIKRTGGGGGPDIVVDRVDIPCRACGSFVQITEDQILFADGLGSPLVWNGVDPTVTTLAGGSKALAFAAAHRGRVFLFGDEAYSTGTVATTSGVTTITTSTSWPATTLGRPTAIEAAGFGSNGAKCFTVVTNVNGTQVTLADAPDRTLSAAKFIVFGGTAAAELQWSADGDHTSWPDAVLPVGKLDGDLPTGIASVGNFVLLFKRSRSYRFDYNTDPNDPNDRALDVISESRGLVAHRSCVVIEGTAYCMDQFGGEAGFWVTRGGALFPLDIGRAISPATRAGQDYELDWSKSSCWFGVWEPDSNSIWWFATKVGDNYPKVAFVYNRPNIEGGDEPGRWWINEFEHPCICGITAIGPDGVLRAYIACADPDQEGSIYLAAITNRYGDMALASNNGTVRKKVSNTVLDLGKHTALHVGSRVEINGVTRTVTADDTVQATFSSSWGNTDVVNKAWKAGWKPRVRFKTIYISPEPGYSKCTIDQVHALFVRENSNAELRLGIESDGNTKWHPELGGAGSSTGAFKNEERLVSMSLGFSGYEMALIFDLYSPGGYDAVHSVDIIKHKQIEPGGGMPSELL